MRGYHRNREPYLTRNRYSDHKLFYMMLLVLFNISMAMTTWALWAGNPFAEWKGQNVLMPWAVLWLTLGLGLLFYVLQTMRMAYYYVAGWENWIGNEPRLDTFEVHPGMDLARALVVCLVTSIASGIINFIMQSAHTRDNALHYGTMATTSVAMITVVTPIVVMTMRKIRNYRIHKLETYRQLGGEG